IVGACFAALGLYMTAPMLLLPQVLPSWGGDFWLFGPATILGWISVTQIRRSAGKIRGLWLAVFDGLLFPLLALNAFLFSVENLDLVAPIGVNFVYWHGFKLMIPYWLLTLFVLGIIAFLDYFIIRRVWRAVNKSSTAVPPAAASSSRRESAQTENRNPRQSWWTWSPLQSPEMRDIWIHLTKEERNQATLISLVGGVAYAAVMILAIQTWMSSTPRLGIWIVFSVFVTLLIVCFPIGARLLRKLLCATTWAKQRGYKPEQFRMLSLRGNNLWKGLSVLLVGLLLALGQSKLFMHLSGGDELSQSLKVSEEQTKKQMSQLAVKRKKNEPSFGPVIERVVGDMNDETNNLLNLASGRVYSFPVSIVDSRGSEAITWYRINRIDVIGKTETSLLRGLDMIVHQTPNAWWDKITTEQLDTLLAQSKNEQAKSEVLQGFAGGSTFFFKTREGCVGLLQTPQFFRSPRGVKLRYKLVQNKPESAANPFLVKTCVATSTTDLHWGKDTAITGGWKTADGNRVFF
ncbi:MAG: hypothetical protein WCS42_28410, partial [Verrucomicrobiota bacterium]